MGEAHVDILTARPGGLARYSSCSGIPLGSFPAASSFIFQKAITAMSQRTIVVLKLLPVAAVIGLLALFFSRTAERNGSGVAISRFGHYRLDSGNRLIVYNDNNIVKFTVQDRDGRALCESDVRPSNYSRWYFYVEPTDESVWMYSGDIGTHRWQRGSDGRYGSHEGVFDLPPLLQHTVDND